MHSDDICVWNEYDDMNKYDLLLCSSRAVCSIVASLVLLMNCLPHLHDTLYATRYTDCTQKLDEINWNTRCTSVLNIFQYDGTAAILAKHKNFDKFVLYCANNNNDRHLHFTKLTCALEPQCIVGIFPYSTTFSVRTPRPCCQCCQKTINVFDI